MGALILRAQDICDRLATDDQVFVKVSKVRSTLKADLGLSYRKVKWVPLKGNSPQSLVLRQKFGMYLLS